MTFFPFAMMKRMTLSASIVINIKSLLAFLTNKLYQKKYYEYLWYLMVGWLNDFLHDVKENFFLCFLVELILFLFIHEYYECLDFYNVSCYAWQNFLQNMIQLKSWKIRNLFFIRILIESSMLSLKNSELIEKINK